MSDPRRLPCLRKAGRPNRNHPALPVHRDLLSPEDRYVETLEKVNEYVRFGVPWVWVIDPASLTGQIYTEAGASPAENAKFFTDRIEIDLAAARM